MPGAVQLGVDAVLLVVVVAVVPVQMLEVDRVHRVVHALDPVAGEMLEGDGAGGRARGPLHGPPPRAPCPAAAIGRSVSRDRSGSAAHSSLSSASLFSSRVWVVYLNFMSPVTPPAPARV